MGRAARSSTLKRTQANTFAAVQFDRAAEHRENMDWLSAQERSPHARFVVLDGRGDVLAVNTSDGLHLFDAEQRSRWLAQTPAHLLGVHGDNAWFLLVAADTDAALIDAALGTRRLQLREAGLLLDPFAAGLVAYAVALTHWHASARFCGRCGSTLRMLAAGHRAECPGCRQLQFPRTDAAVIVIVEHDDACLLGRQSGWPEKRYSALAGFVEPGETLEHAVCREVHEEAGLDIVDVTYHSSQPWPFPASLMIGFIATARERTIILRDGELEDARWYSRDQLVDAVLSDELRLSSPVSVSWSLLDHWLTMGGGPGLSSLGVVAANRA